jgi:hypothetical protein
MRRLQATLPLQASGTDPVRDLKTLLVRRSGLATLQRDLEAEIENRVPRPPVGPGPDAPPVVDRVTLADLNPPALITSDKELDEWLSALRAQLRAKLRANKQIKLE